MQCRNLGKYQRRAALLFNTFFFFLVLSYFHERPLNRSVIVFSLFKMRFSAFCSHLATYPTPFSFPPPPILFLSLSCPPGVLLPWRPPHGFLCRCVSCRCKRCTTRPITSCSMGACLRARPRCLALRMTAFSLCRYFF